MLLLMLSACEEAPSESTSAAESGPETGGGDIAGCECMVESGNPENTCAAGALCGTYHEVSNSCDDATGGSDPEEDAFYAESNAMVVQCILDEAAAGGPFRFAHAENASSPTNCRTEYAFQPGGTLQSIATEQHDLCFDYVTSISSGFDVAACAGMSGPEGWECIQAAIADATVEGSCWEDRYCEG